MVWRHAVRLPHTMLVSCLSILPRLSSLPSSHLITSFPCVKRMRCVYHGCEMPSGHYLYYLRWHGQATCIQQTLQRSPKHPYLGTCTPVVLQHQQVKQQTFTSFGYLLTAIPSVESNQQNKTELVTQSEERQSLSSKHVSRHILPSPPSWPISRRSSSDIDRIPAPDSFFNV